MSTRDEIFNLVESHPFGGYDLVDQILSIPELAEGLELLERVRKGMTIEAIITAQRKRPNLIISEPEDHEQK